MAEPSRCELVHRNICRTYDEAIAECVSKEADLVAWNGFADQLVALIWPSESERPECDELGGYTHAQLLDGVCRLLARIARMQSEPAYREDAYALVERELRELGVYDVGVMYLDCGVTLSAQGPNRRAEGTTLIETVDLLRKP